MAQPAAVLQIYVRANTAQANAGLAKTQGHLRQTEGRAHKSGAALKSFAKTSALAGVGVAVAAVKMATNFNQAMVQVHTQAGASAKEVKNLRGRVLDLARASEFSPTELAKGLFRVESAGFRGAEAMKVLKTASDLAAVGQSDLESTTNALTGAMRSHIKGTETAAKTAGTLNAAIGLGNLRMQDMVSALGTGILPVAKAFGLSLRDVTSALDVMTKRGIPATQAATRLRMTFSLMASPTDKAVRALGGIHLKSDELAKAMRKPDGLVTAIRLLHDHLQGLSKVKQAQVLSKIFGGGRTSSAILTLVQNVDELSKTYDQTGKNTRKFGADVEAQNRIAEHSFKVGWNRIQVALIQIGNKILPKVATEFNKVTRIISDPKLTSGQKFQKLADEFAKLLGQLAKAAAKAAPRVVLAFVSGFLHAGPWGRLAIGAFLLTKLKAWPLIFGGLGRRSGAAFSAGVAETAALGGVGGKGGKAGAVAKTERVGASAGLAAGALIPGAKTGAKALGFLKSAAPVAKRVGFVALGLAAISGAEEAFGDRSKRLEFSGKVQNFFHGALASVGLGRLAPRSQDNFNKLLSQIVRGGTPHLRKEADGMFAGAFKLVSGHLPSTKREFKLGKAAIDDSGLNKQSKRVLLRMFQLQRQAKRIFGKPVPLKLLADEGRLRRSMRNIQFGFTQLRGHFVILGKDILKRSKYNFREIARDMGVNSAAGRSAVQKNMRLTDKAIQFSLSHGRLTAEQAMRAILKSFRINSRRSKETASVNFNAASAAIKRAVNSGKVSAGRGLNTIATLFRQYLGALGIHGKEARLLERVQKKYPGYAPGPQGVFAGGARGGLFQLGQVGARGQDSIPLDVGGRKIIAAPGEQVAVFNRHQLPVVNARLSDMGGLPGLFKKYNTPHHMARGGLVSKARGGYVWPFGHAHVSWGRVDQGVDFSGSGPIQAIGPGRVTSTGAPGWPGGGGVVYKLTGGPRAGQSIFNFEHVRALVHAGQKLRPGQVIANLIGGFPGLETGFSTPGGVPLSHAEYTEGKATRWGKEMYSFLKALQRGGGAGLFGGMAVPRIPRVLVSGPDSPYKAIVQGVLDKDRHAAQSKLNQIAAAFAPGSNMPGGSPSFGPGRLSRAQVEGLWVRAGGPRSMAHQMANVAWAESRWNPRAFNHRGTGAAGLWQIHPPQPGSLDAFKNAQQAVAKWRGGGLAPWAASSPWAGAPAHQRGGLVGGTAEIARHHSHRHRRHHQQHHRRRRHHPPKVKPPTAKQKRTLEHIRRLGLSRGMTTRIARLSNEAARMGEYADSASSIGDNGKGVFRGNTEITWLKEQLRDLFILRNTLIRAYNQLKRLAKHLRHLIHHPGRHLGRDQRRRVVGVAKSQLANVRARMDELLTGDNGLETIQGRFGSMRVMKHLPKIGGLGGSILDTQIKLRDFAQPADTTDTSGTTSDRSDLLTQLLAESNLRTAVSQKQFDVFKNLPFAGSFAEGGVVPGPVGRPMAAVVHGGEVIGQPGEVRVYLQFADGMKWLERFVDVRVEQGTRKQSRSGARVLPGRGGG